VVVLECFFGDNPGVKKYVLTMVSIDPVRIFKFDLFPAQRTKFYFKFKLHRMHLQQMKVGRGLYRRSKSHNSSELAD
jgi:hypothetical protein